MSTNYEDRNRGGYDSDDDGDRRPMGGRGGGRRMHRRRVCRFCIDKVDLMTGLYAEPLPPGFGFSDTAFRIFILMASRRLKSDRFFTDDYRADFYTEFGIQYLKDTSMLTLLKRHYPELKPALEKVTNAFQPWRRLS